MLRHLAPFAFIAVTTLSCAPVTVETGTENTSPSALADSRLSPGDHRLDSGEYYETLSYAGQSGQFVTISLESHEFDPYLMVLDPNGNKIAEIDDSVGYGHNILVSLNLTMSGSYTLIVTSYEPGETGAFTLNIDSDMGGGPATPIWQSSGAA